MITMESFGMWLVREMDKRGWSIDEFSRRCDVNRATILRVVGGARRPSSDLCVRIANAFDVTWREVILYACQLDCVSSEIARLKKVTLLFAELSNEEQEMVLMQVHALVQKKRLGRLVSLEQLPPF